MSERSDQSGSARGGGNGSAALDTVDSAQWLLSVMRSNPAILSLRERYLPLASPETDRSFSRVPNAGRTEAETSLDSESVTGLLLGWLVDKGYRKTAKALMLEAAVDPNAMRKVPLGALVPMLQGAAPENDQVFSVDGVGGGMGMARLASRGPDAGEVDQDVLSGKWVPNVCGDLDDTASSPWDALLAIEKSGIDDLETRPLNLNQIACLLIRDDANRKQILLVTHTAWSSTGEILKKLFRLFHIPSASKLSGTEEGRQHERKVIRAIAWFSLASSAPVDLLSGLLNRFANQVALLGNVHAAAEIRKVVVLLSRPRPLSAPKNWEQPQVPPNIFSSSMSFFQIPLVEVARQMTLLDHELFVKMTSNELLSLGWLSPMERERALAPNVCALLRRFTALGKWVVKAVEWETSVAGATSLISFFLKLCSHLLQLNSYHSALALFAGIQSDELWQHQSIFSGLVDEEKDTLQRLRAFAGRAQNWSSYFAVYNATLGSASSVAMVPFVLPHLFAISMAMLSQPSWSPEGFLNLAKFTRLFNILSDLKLVGARIYPFLKVEQVQHFLTTGTLEATKGPLEPQFVAQ